MASERIVRIIIDEAIDHGLQACSSMERNAYQAPDLSQWLRAIERRRSNNGYEESQCRQLIGNLEWALAQLTIMRILAEAATALLDGETDREGQGG